MSGESVHHARLVELLFGFVGKTHNLDGNLVIFADHHSFGKNRPPKIGGFVPDLFAHTIPDALRIIGEAKTSGDLISNRSRSQITAFLEHLSLRQNSIFYLIVPWQATTVAVTLLKGLRFQRTNMVKARILHDASADFINVEIG